MKLKLNMGCGNDIRVGWVNLDLPSFDLRQPWVFREGEIEAVLLKHVMEHLDGEAIRHVMKEAERVLEVGGTMEIRVPFYRCLDSIADPTHKTPFELNTWEHVSSYAPELVLGSLSLNVDPIPLVGIDDSFRFPDPVWDKMVRAADVWGNALTEVVVGLGFRHFQEMVPPWLRVEWVAVYRRRS